MEQALNSDFLSVQTETARKMLHRLFKKIEYSQQGIQTDYDDTRDRLDALQDRHLKLVEADRRL